MFIKSIKINNFRIYKSDSNFTIDDINTPDGANEGSGLNVFVGENGCGKTALLDALSLPLLEYKTDSFSIEDFNDPTDKVVINILSKNEFDVDGTMPKGSFKAKGFTFEGGIRSRENKAYLSSIAVSDQKFIAVDSTKPSQSSPDLRVNVNNPFKGKRFNENDVLYLDKNRLFQTRCGNFNKTRFDRLMEDFNFQYLKKSTLQNLNDDLDMKIKIDKVENAFLAQAVKKFHEISGLEIRLDFINNCEPFKTGFFATKRVNNQQIPLNNLGSGYEMIFSLLYSFYLAQQSGKQLIILIDEPELHLHPRLQEKFVDFILDFSKIAQIFITSHSSLLVKQIAINSQAKISVLKTDGSNVYEIQKRVLPYPSANEINFLAFGLATEEYHNELYEELRYINGDKQLKLFDNDFLHLAKGEPQDSPWMGTPNQVTKHTFIRNQIHHIRDNGKTEYQDLKKSIEILRAYF
jgi:predicted ATP-dependent endonuclease of OLD family